jgi:hypothetical protein
MLGQVHQANFSAPFGGFQEVFSKISSANMVFVGNIARPFSETKILSGF